MAYVSRSEENFYVVYWGQPTAQDCLDIVSEVKQLGKLVGRPINYLGIMPENLTKIDDAARKGLTQLVNDLLPYCGIVNVVVEMKGFTGSLMRSLMTGVLIATGRSDKIKFVDSVKTALENSRQYNLADRKKMLATLEQVSGSKRFETVLASAAI